MVLEHVNNDNQLQEILNSADYRLVIVDFYADWCPPCRMIAPVFEQLSNFYQNVIFAKVNVDNCRSTSQLHNVSAMPTFILFVRGREVERLQGANGDRLRQLIDLHFQEPPKEDTNKANAAERQWLHQNLVSRVDFVNQYEDEVNRMLALSVIPLDDINQKSTVDGKISAFAQATHLMDWFYGYFKWINQPDCYSCGDKETKCIETTDSTSDEKAMGGDRVEVFDCGKCSSKTRFVRYNNPATLIETREGRCGEWANCFTLCCRAIGLEARYIHGTEDHIWTEIYDPDRKQWIHCDPCENVIDRPLLYEKGWKKEIKYALGISHDHVQDVTWRYVFNQESCKKRRTLCREPVLLNCITKLNQRLEKGLTEERKKELKDRQLVELIQFLSPALNLRGSDEEQGRGSGSMEWRVARGETKVEHEKKHEPVVIKPTVNELAAKSMIIEYNCVNDVYIRPNDKNSESKGFLSLMNQADNVVRKLERDWKMAYICRKEGSKSSDFSWKFSFEGQKVKRAHILLGEFALYASGKGMATVCGGDLCSMVEDGGIELNELEGADYLELSVNLRGGDGDVAWQHAQLFRSALNEPKANLRIVIEFE